MEIKQFAMIIGAMKCGTSYLFNYLAQHPEIASSQPKEPEFFTQNYEKGMEWYYELFKFNPQRHKVALEASTGYTKYPHFPSLAEEVNTAERIKESGIPVKFIYVMRDPIERIESHYNYGIAMGWGRGREILDESFINCSKYAMQLDEYMNRFPREDILLLNFSDIKEDIMDTSKHILSFLNLEAIDLSKTSSKTENIQQNRTVGQKAESNLLISLKEQLSALKELYRNILPHEVRSRINTLMTYEYTEIKKLSEQQKKQIFLAIEADIKRLPKEYQFDTNCWQTYSQFAVSSK